MKFLDFFRTPQQATSTVAALPGFPQTLDEAITRLLHQLDDDQTRKLAALSEQGVEGLNYGLGARIRKEFGLWHGNPALMRSCDTHNPEDTSMVIIRATWAVLRDGTDTVPHP
jgi:hypothetical protein